jgi:hypothetical protein
MDFHLATSRGDVYLFSKEGDRTFCLLDPPPVGKPPAPAAPPAEPALE